MSKKEKDILISLIFVVFGIGMAIYSQQYRNSSLFETDVGSSFLPMVCSVGIAVLSLIHMIGAIFNKSEEYCAKPNKTHDSEMDFVRGLATIGLLIFYVATFRALGFLISSIIYLFAQLMVFTKKGKRRWLLNSIISVALPGTIYVLFLYVMNYMLPMGILG